MGKQSGPKGVTLRGTRGVTQKHKGSNTQDLGARGATHRTQGGHAQEPGGSTEVPGVKHTGATGVSQRDHRSNTQDPWCNTQRCHGSNTDGCKV